MRRRSEASAPSDFTVSMPWIASIWLPSGWLSADRVALDQAREADGRAGEACLTRAAS